MPDLYISTQGDGTFRLKADVSQKSCGESRTEYFTIDNNLTLERAIQMVDAGIALWDGPAPRCNCCGRAL